MFRKLFNIYNQQKPDYKFIIVFFTLVLFGLLVLSSASAPISLERFDTAYYYLNHQLLYGFMPGFFLFIIFSVINYRKWRSLSFLMLGVSIALLALVFIPGIGAEFGTAKSWINVGDYSLQPSEIVKLTFLIYLAAWLEARGQHRASDLNEGLIPFVCVFGVIAVLMLLQPDLGTLLIIASIAFGVYFIGGAKISHVIGIGIVGFSLLMLMISISPYRAARLTTFLHPELDPQGIGYQINQAFLAIGSGGFIGRGFGLSRQKFQYLPEVMGDSIFAILSEELGFIFSVLVILSFVYLMNRGMKISFSAPDIFGRLLGSGIIIWLTVQSFLNIGAIVGIMPLTGVPLPFISYGGTSLMMTMAAVGLLINISRYSNINKN